jgi:hypothetical protein
MSPAACAGFPPGPRSESLGTAELLCLLLCSGLAVAERTEQGMKTALVGVEAGRVLGPKAAGPEAVFYGAQPKDVGCAAVLARCSPARPWPPARPRLIGNGREGQLAARRTRSTGGRACARYGRSDTGGDHQLRGRR